MKHSTHANLTQAPLFAYRLDEVITGVLTDSPQTVEQIAAQVNAFVVETSSALCLMVMEGRARIGMGFTYTKPQETQEHHR